MHSTPPAPSKNRYAEALCTDCMAGVLAGVHAGQTSLTLIAISKRRMTSGIRARFPQRATARLPVVAPTRKLPQMMAKMHDLLRAISLSEVNSQSNSPVLSVLRLPVVKVEVYVCGPTVRNWSTCIEVAKVMGKVI